ncbi:hypothetical protein MP638_005268 [Amoeboaphelidium occidentale]|nr:hypothetical protein MP638_005268 [Amoeboaphelidium occidentale]
MTIVDDEDDWENQQYEKANEYASSESAEEDEEVGEEYNEDDEEEEDDDDGEDEEDDDDTYEKDLRQQYIKRIHYSSRYSDEHFEYRHVILPKDYYANYVPSSMKNRLLSEDEWRSIGITQSPGWVHYELHMPEPHIFLFRRDKE